MTMSVVYTNFGGRIVYEMRGSENYRHLSDPLGSSIAMIDTSDGSTVCETEYWPYGEVQEETGTRPSPLGYVGLFGYLRDLATLLYVRARHYLPGKGRWLTFDPLWPREGAYAYAESIPCTYLDPFGMTPKLQNSPGPSLFRCKKLKPRPRCFACAYEFYLNSGSPYNSCVLANRLCGSHIRCKPCGTTDMPPYTGGCNSREIWKYGNLIQQICRHADKVSHCCTVCQAAKCYSPLHSIATAAACFAELWGDPNDIPANLLGEGCGKFGEDCLSCCAKETSILPIEKDYRQ